MWKWCTAVMKTDPQWLTVCTWLKWHKSMEQGLDFGGLAAIRRGVNGPGGHALPEPMPSPPDHAAGGEQWKSLPKGPQACLQVLRWMLLQAHSWRQAAPSGTHSYTQGCPRSSCFLGMWVAWMCRLQCLPSYVGTRDQDRARDGMRTKELAFHKPPRAGTEPKESEKHIECSLLGCYEGVLVKEGRCILFSSLMYNLIHGPPLIFLPPIPSCPSWRLSWVPSLKTQPNLNPIELSASQIQWSRMWAGEFWWHLVKHLHRPRGASWLSGTQKVSQVPPGLQTWKLFWFT